MRQKNLVIGLLVMLALVVSGFTYAYWASNIVGASGTNTGSITIGSGEEVTTSVEIGSAGLVEASLVPTAYTSTPGTSVEGEDYVLLTFLVTWTGDGADGASSTISITDTVFSGLGTVTEGQYTDMFEVVIESGATVVAGTPSNVVVRVTFANEPDTQAIYNEVALGTLVVTLTFTVANIPA